MSCALRGVAHDRVGVGLEIANVAVLTANCYSGIRAARILLERYVRVVRPAVIRPGDSLVVESFADGADIRRGIQPPFAIPLLSTVPSGRKPGLSLLTM